MTQRPEKRVIAPPPTRRPGPASPASHAVKAKGGGTKNKKVANSLVALSSAAILSVYGLGYVRTNAAQGLDNVGAPVIAIATAAPMATDAAPSPVAAYQSPLFPPPTAAATLGLDGSTQGMATVAAPPPTAPSDGGAQDVATATTAAAAASVPAMAVKVPATATTVPPTATTAPLPRAMPPATTIPSSIAKAPAAATSAPAATALYKDGTYSGTGTSRHGNISASVVVQGGKIISAAITQCGTRYPCSDIAALPGQVVTRQSAPVNFVSGATDSSQAYRGAIQNALAKAKGTA
jgi:uncharacterized protein with FMN-binding domain